MKTKHKIDRIQTNMDCSEYIELIGNWFNAFSLLITKKIVAIEGRHTELAKIDVLYYLQFQSKSMTLTLFSSTINRIVWYEFQFYKMCTAHRLS